MMKRNAIKNRRDGTGGSSSAYGDDKYNHLYRIVQEALKNAIKHGKATCIAIRLFLPRRNWSSWITKGQGICLKEESRLA